MTSTLTPRSSTKRRAPMPAATRQQPSRSAAPPAGGSAGPVVARIRLGRIFRPMPMEYIVLASTAFVLTVFGVVMVMSATSVASLESGSSAYSGGESQAIFGGVAMIAMIVISRIPLRWIRVMAWPALLFSLVLQFLVFTPLGITVGGNRNWLKIAGQQIQPSEFLKVSLALWMAFIIWRKRKYLHKIGHMLIPLVPVAVVVLASVMAGSDLGTASIMAMIVLGALLFAGIKLRYLVLPVLAAATGAAAYTLTSSNRMARFETVFTDCLAPHQVLDSCYQPLHGVWGLADGGIFGLGLGNSKEKYGWLPAIADDYMFSLVGEELGLIGCIALMVLYAVFAWAALRIVRRTTDVFVRVAVGSLTVWIVGQALVNIGVVLRLLPPLGVPLPFMSAGGSSLVAIGVGCGIVLACAASLPVETTRSPSRRQRRVRAAATRQNKA